MTKGGRPLPEALGAALSGVGVAPACGEVAGLALVAGAGRQLFTSPTDGSAWVELGRTLWDRAVAERSASLRRMAEECLDIARVLLWPWTGGPPQWEYERMQMIRLGDPPRPIWPDDDEPRAIRAGAIAFLAEPGGADAWVAMFYRRGARFADRASPPTRFWVTLAVTETLGDREERARAIEGLRALEPEAFVPAWLTAREAGGRPVEVSGALRRLAERVGAAGAASACLDRTCGEVLLACRDHATVVALGIEALGQVPGDPLAALDLLQLLGRAARRHGADGAALAERVARAARGLPAFERGVAALGASNGPAVDDLLSLLPDDSRGLGPRLQALARGVADVPSERRAAAASAVLDQAERRLERISERREITVTVVEAARGLPLADLLEVQARARRGWTAASDHDRVTLALVNNLIGLARTEPSALEEARHLSTSTDRVAARALVMLRLASAYHAVDPGQTRRLAEGALRRLRSVEDAGAWPLRIEAARLLARGGHDEGIMLLRDVARRLDNWPARRLLAPALALCVRGLAEAGASDAECGELARTVAARIAPAAPRRLAELYLQRWLRSATSDGAPRRLRWPAAYDLEASLAEHLAPGATAGPLQERLVELIEPAPAQRVDEPDLARGSRVAAAAGKVTAAREVVAVAFWALAQRRPALAAAGALLAAEAVETLLARRAEEAAVAARTRLGQACLERVRAAARA